MNKSDLIEAVAHRVGEPKARVSKMLDAVLESITAGVADDDKVAITGFGTFSKSQRKERSGIHPVTKEPTIFAATISVKFRPSQYFKDQAASKPPRRTLSSNRGQKPTIIVPAQSQPQEARR